MKNKNLLLIMFSVFILLAAACSNKNNSAESTANDSERDELILAIGGEPDDGFDPVTGWGRYGSPLFQSTLLKYDVDFNVINDLAQDYEISSDGLEWLVTIRDDVKFSDGEPLTADDVVFTYEKAKTSGSIVDLHNLDSVEKVDSHTITFKLKEPQSSFLYVLIATGIVPKHAYGEDYNENPIGSGPFQLLQWNKGQQLIVEQNPYYYGQPSFFKKLTFLFLSEDAAFAAAKAGEVDIALATPAFAKEKIPGMKLVNLDSVDNRGITLPYVPSGESTAEGLPIGNDVTSDIAIRHAINIAVDREALVEGVLEGFGTPAYTIVDHLPWWNPDTVFEDNDVEQAKKILENAGWTENAKGIREKDGIEASFVLMYPAQDQTRQSLSMTFAEMMKPLGINVTTEGKSWDEIGQLMHANPVLMGKGSHDPLAMYHEYSSNTRGQGYSNANYYSNPDVDAYLDQALRTTSEEEANDFWKKAQWDGKTGLSAKGDAPWVWLVNLQHLYFVKENLEIGEQKIQPHGHGWPITDFIEKWHWID